MNRINMFIDMLMQREKVVSNDNRNNLDKYLLNCSMGP